MDNIIVITQNLKLPSLGSIKDKLVPGEVLIVSTQFVFENEREIIDNALGVQCKYLDFADLISDAERQKCDEDAYSPIPHSLVAYYQRIKKLKNEKIVKRLSADYPCRNCIVLCDDLGIDVDVWRNNGYRFYKGEYYYVKETVSVGVVRRIIKVIASQIYQVVKFYKEPIWRADYKGKIYQFYGNTNRIGYRMDLDFHKARKLENIKYILCFFSCKLFGFIPHNNTIRMTSFHEDGKWSLPDHPNMNVKKIQDGYLPPNYTSKYLAYYGKYTEFYTWDAIGRNTFFYHDLKNTIMPFRKKLFLPEARCPQKLKKVLCAASGTGDWTAIKNRSDDDRLVWALGKVAAMFPDVEFIYRCHPVWIHPDHSGVNAINRCAEYISWLNLPNYKLSSNIPVANQKGEFVLSFKRSSFEEDLKDVDIVFGEHSVAMIDAGFKGIPFASCNMTGHRDFFEDITKLGFPHCESIDDIVNLLKNITSPEFKASYEQAIRNYNEMTDKEN